MKKPIEVTSEAIKVERARLLKQINNEKELREVERKQKEILFKQQEEERRLLRIKMIPILKKAIRRSRRITSMVQGTMALEGAALDKKVLWDLTKETVREYLEKIDWALEAQKVREEKLKRIRVQSIFIIRNAIRMARSIVSSRYIYDRVHLRIICDPSERQMVRRLVKEQARILLSNTNFYDLAP